MKPKNILTTTTAPTLTAYTYTVTADNYCSTPKIVFSHSGIHGDHILTTANCLRKAFRKVEVINEQTGEIVFDYYVGDEFFEPVFGITEAIDMVMDYLSA